MKLKSVWIISAIFIVGLLLRLYKVDQFPVSLNWDEISHGYNALSILKTGHDEWGEVLPLANFRAYGDYPLTLNLYLTIPFIAILGLNELAIRLPHVLLGSLTILSVYFFASGLFKNKYLAYFAALLTAVEPWYLFTSRFVLQSNLSVFFLITALALFYNRTKNKIFLPLSVLSFGLTLYAYHSTRILTPLLLLGLLLIYRKDLFDYYKKNKLVTRISILIACIFFIPLPFILFNSDARARANWVFIIDQGAINKINEQRNTSTLPSLATKLIYNRPVYFTEKFLQNYIDYYSPQFLFLNGGTQHQFSIPNTGLLYPINLIFFYVGILALIKIGIKKKDKDYLFLIFWLVIAPIPASITQEKYAVIRATTMLPLPELLTAYGMFEISKRIKSVSVKKISILAYLILIFISTGFYLQKYFAEYAKNYSWAWQYGYKQAIEYVHLHYSDYDSIILTKKYGEPHEYTLFYGAELNAPWSWQPDKFISNPNLIRFNQSNWYWVDRFDKFYFVNDWQIPHDSNTPFKMESGGVVPTNNKTLLVTSPGNYPGGWKIMKTVQFLDGKPAFDIVSNQ